jgi:SNF2 family DNA or RNA helicase
MDETASLTLVEPTSELLESALQARPLSTLEDVALALDAWRLKLTDQFDELLCLARLKDVRRLDYQVETVHRVLRSLRGRALLADEVGLGKTVEAGMLVSEYFLRGMARTALIVCPAALVGQWRAELADKFGLAAQSTEEPSFRGSPEAAWAGGAEPRIVVASLQMVRSARHAELVRAQRWDLVVVDEAHHIKNRSTAGYKLLDSVKSRFLLLLTATPVENDLEELYNLVTLLKPGQLATPAAFKKKFVEKGDPFAPRNRERLRELLVDVLDRRIHLFELVIGEVDLILGRALDEKEFDERIFDIYERSRTEAEVADGFDGLADELAAARGHYDKVKAFDEALFRRDFET